MSQFYSVDIPSEITDIPLFNSTDSIDQFFPFDEKIESATTGYTSGSTFAISSFKCHEYAKFDYEIPAVIVCSICLISGLIYSFFGYRFFKAILFLTGFLFTSILLYLVLQKQKYFSILVNAGISVSSGVLIGLLTMFVQPIGIFAIGFVTGIFVGLIAVTLWQSFLVISSIWAILGTLAAIGLLTALISLKWQRITIILNTSFLGAALLTLALDYVVDRFAVVERVWEAVNGSERRLVQWDAVCWYGWLVLAIWPCLFALGSIVQWVWTSVGHDHRKGFHFCFKGRSTETEIRNPARSIDRIKNGSIRGGKQLSYVCKTEDESAGKSAVTSTVSRHRCASGESTTRSLSYESKPWRTIYQSRRAHGDVICQSYLESLTRLSSQTQNSSPKWGSMMDTPTLASDHTRLTALTSGSNKSLHCRDFGKSPSVM